MHNGLSSTGTDNYVIDHCSFSFNDHQAISFNANYGPLQNGTVQRSVFSENATGAITGLTNKQKEPRLRQAQRRQKVLGSDAVDPLREQDIVASQRERPEVKFRQAIEMMATGLKLKRAALRQQNPQASEEEIQQLFEQWLVADDRTELD